MTLSELSIRRPVLTTMVTMLIVVLGFISVGRLGTDLFPDIAIPVVLVQTVYRGAGPQELETQVVKPIEDAVAGLNGVDFIHSWSRDNAGIIVVQFNLSADIDRAVADVRDKVSGVQNKLPREADPPKVSRFDIAAQPILTYAASAKLSSTELRRLIEDRLKPALAQVDGVAEVRITGGDVREIRVDVDMEKAKAAGVAPASLAQQLTMENLDVPAGRLELGPSQVSVRSVGQFRTVQELETQPVARSQSGAQVRLNEVATVTDGVAPRTTVARLNGEDAVLVEVIKSPGSNTVLVANQVKARMAKMTPVLGNAFAASLLVDQSALIRGNAEEVWVALIFGGFAAICIILMFLLDVRGTIISSLALPTSVIGTFFMMYLLGYSMNQMTLLALTLAIGLLIDDAVVVREAITHRLEKGESPMHAAAHGTRDVYLAVLATTLSLVSVFVPVAFMPGMVGQFFKQFGLTISAAVLISLFISFTLDPMLSARFARQRTPGEVHRENAVAAWLRKFFEANERWYHSLLAWVLKHKWQTALLSLTVVAVAGLSGTRLKAEFLPAEDRSQFSVDLQLGDGASLAASQERAAQAEAVIRQFPEVTSVFSVVGFNGDANKVRMKVLLKEKDQRERGVGAIKEALRPKLAEALVATKVALIDPPPIEGGGDFYPIMLRVTGNDFTELTRQATRARDMLLAIKGTADVRIDLVPPRPEWQVTVNRARASDVDLSAAALGSQLRLAINGQTVGKLREGTTETDIVVRLSEADRASPEKLSDIDVFSARGARPVSEVAEVALHDAPSVIERHNRERQLTVSSNIAPGGALGAVVDELEAKLAADPMPPGYGYSPDGQMKLFKEQMKSFASMFGLAFVFLYMVLASQFESFKHPFTIIFSVPLALIGAVLALVATGHNLSLGAMIGVILLMGLVTKNAILLVDGALQNMRNGDDVDTALLKAGPRRLRPILMTSAAMAIGMVPTALGNGVGSEFRSPMAIAVIGGVITSTFLTLVVVPVVFSFFEWITPRRFKITAEKTFDDEPEEEAAPVRHLAEAQAKPHEKVA